MTNEVKAIGRYDRPASRFTPACLLNLMKKHLPCQIWLATPQVAPQP